MSRAKPTILLEITDKNYKSEQILSSDGIWAIFYDQKPINFKKVHSLINETPKYKKTSFSNPGHAINLCKKLNKKFKTDKFTVTLLIEGSQVYP